MKPIDPWMIVATLAGALILWCKEGGSEKLRVYTLAPIIEKLVPGKHPALEYSRYCVQLVVFAVLGTFLAILLTEPTSAKQAFASGLGWTALLSKKT